jgi:hypothetical protein
MKPGLPVFTTSLNLVCFDFVKGVFRKDGDVETLPRTSRSFARGKQSRATMHRPSQ